MAAEPFFMIGCEVGPAGLDAERPLAIGRFRRSDVRLNLTKPGRFGTVESILKDYGVETDKLPLYVRRALQLQATIQRFDYESTRVATVSKDTPETFTPWSGAASVDEELKGAKVTTITTDDKEVLVVADSTGKRLTNYDVRSTDTTGEYAIGKVTYTFVLVAQYAEAFPLIRGVLAIKFLAFAISNDAAFKGKEEDQVQLAFTQNVKGQLLPEGKTELPAAR
jgi:hypothetical protein